MYRKNKAIFNGCYTNSLFYDMKLCLHDTGDEKLPKMDALKKQRRKLADEKKALYALVRVLKMDVLICRTFCTYLLFESIYFLKAVDRLTIVRYNKPNDC